MFKHCCILNLVYTLLKQNEVFVMGINEEIKKDLNVTDDSVVVENVHLSDSLMQLSYNIVKNKK